MVLMTMTQAKIAAAERAAALVQREQIIGLGTGTTAAYFIEALARRSQKENLNIQTVSSSQSSEALAKQKNLTTLDLSRVPRVDMTVDGADEVDTKMRMIKGKGGAHVKERILAASSQTMVVIIDETKWVSALGKAKLPAEIIPYGSTWTEKKIEALGFTGTWRRDRWQQLLLSENGNYTFDIAFKETLEHPEVIDRALRSIPGVVDTGFFFNLARTVIVGHENGTTSFFE